MRRALCFFSTIVLFRCVYLHAQSAPAENPNDKNTAAKAGFAARPDRSVRLY
jgi:hypothetical protein